MKKLASLTIAAALAVMTFGGSVQAATLDFTLGSGGFNPAAFTTGGTLSPNINLTNTTPATLLLQDDALVLGNISLPGIATEPTGSLFGNSYLAVVANPTPAGTATFTLGAHENLFGFTWGTIDSFNNLSITDSRGVIYNITGADILNALGNPGGNTQANVIFTDPFGNIVTAKLTSSGNSFETANFQESVTPLPASLPLFLTALLGMAILVFFARGRKFVKI